MPRHRLRVLLTIATLAGAAACSEQPVPDDGDELPALEWEGERVILGTDLVDEVCAGTLANLDRTVASIESELDLEPSNEKIRIYVAGPEVLQAACGPRIPACVTHGDLYTSAEGFDRVRHELVHARLSQLGIWGKPLFFEGIAAALDQDGGCLASQACASVDLDALLAATKSSELFDTGYTPGADLVHGLLVTQGPERVLAFMAELTKEMSPDEVRSIYLEHFGSVIDEDFQAFMRGPYDEFTLAQLTLGSRSCDSLIPAAFEDAGRVTFEGIMDCSSPAVVNDFRAPGKFEIRWTFEVPPDLSGTFVRGWAPEAEYFELKGCYPPPLHPSQLADSGPYSPTWPRSSTRPSAMLGPGRHVLRWRAELNATFDFELSAPCIFELGGCSVGNQCTIWNACVAEVESPAALGETCTQSDGSPSACEAGSRCMLGRCMAECDATQPCEGGDACARIRVCGPTCDLLAQDCEPGFSCLPTGDDDDLNNLGMGACVASGQRPYLDPCDLESSQCGAGLTCEAVEVPSTAPCHDSGLGCCVPFCEATATDPGCPAQTSACDPLREGPVGTCGSG